MSTSKMEIRVECGRYKTLKMNAVNLLRINYFNIQIKCEISHNSNGLPNNSFKCVCCMCICVPICSFNSHFSSFHFHFHFHCGFCNDFSLSVCVRVCVCRSFKKRLFILCLQILTWKMFSFTLWMSFWY